MTKRCFHCSTDIPFAASRCPNCTTVLSMSSGDGDAGAAMVLILLFVVFGVGNCLGLIK